MPATIVVGGQYGSEGKGKVVALLANSRPTSCVVRCGGPNSGHTTLVHGSERVLRQLPSSVGLSDSTVAIAAGAVIDIDVLAAEIKEVGLQRSRIVIDPRAAIVTEDDRQQEGSLTQTIGGTGSGNGRALSRRMLRESNDLAGNSADIKRLARVEAVAPLVHRMLRKDEHIIIEGTQGFGLSLLHGSEYPYVTSKDTTAATFAAEVGISPRDVDQIVMVIRSFPIRVAGNSGPLSCEVTWEHIQKVSGAPVLEPEFTSVTRKLRRVGEFDLKLVQLAADYNRPTTIAVMGLDRLDFRNRHASNRQELTSTALSFLKMIETELKTPIGWVGTGSGTFDAFHLNSNTGKEVNNAA